MIRIQFNFEFSPHFLCCFSSLDDCGGAPRRPDKNLTYQFVLLKGVNTKQQHNWNWN